MAWSVDLSGKSGVVTGSSSGIGAATVRALLDCGARVAGWDAADPPPALSDLPGFVHRRVDVRDESAIAQAAVAHADEPLDLFVHSAGAARRGAAVELSAADWDLVNEINLRGAFLCARALAPRMRSGGSIVAVASVMGLSGGLFANAAYQASKGGLVNLTRALALEWAPLGLRVNAVAPTYTDTPFVRAVVEDPAKLQRIVDATPLRRLAQPEEVADAIVFLLSDRAAMITGHTLPVDGGFLAQ